MKKQSKVSQIILFVLSGFFAILGIAQLVLTLPPVLEMTNSALELGQASAEDVIQYLFTYSILPVLALGVAAILLATGLICSKITKMSAGLSNNAPAAEIPAQIPYTTVNESYFEPDDDDDLDDMFADAENVGTVEEKNG